LCADAVYIATAALIAINCEQYRICHTGLCPTGITTNNPTLVKQLDLEEGIRKLSNYILLSTQEIANFSRILGKNDISQIDIDDIISLNKDLSTITGVKYLDGK
jgi:glutamate synthase domain-containing protein 2